MPTTVFTPVFASPVPAWPSVRDMLQLSKPGITLMSVMVAAGAQAVAWASSPLAARPSVAILTLVGVALSVAGAGALNQWWERELDGRMSRTRSRPLPAGRVDPAWALWFGARLSLLAAIVLFMVSPLVGVLNLVAQVLYVAVYTPMKQRTSWALVVGAVPGAMPALLGYVAASGQIDAVGMSLFGFVFFWQLPHFLAITLYRDKEYAKAGYVVAASVLGARSTRHLVLATALPTVGVSLLLWPLGVTGAAYGIFALLIGLWFLGLCLKGYRAKDLPAWARKVFFGTLVYQCALFAVLGVEVGARVLF